MSAKPHPERMPYMELIAKLGLNPNAKTPEKSTPTSMAKTGAAANDPVALSGCGLTVAPANADAIAHGLQALAAMGADARAAMGQRGQAHVLAHHTWPVLAQRFLDALT